MSRTGFVPRKGSTPRRFAPPPSTEEQIQQRRSEIEAAHAARMTWAEGCVADCLAFYGVSYQRDRRELACRIARDMCGEHWGWQVFETMGGDVVFSILEYRPCGGPASPADDGSGGA